MIDITEFEKESLGVQMGNIISVINQLVEKVIEVDVTINLDSDGLLTKIATAQTQADVCAQDIVKVKTANSENVKKIEDSIADIELLKSENTILKGIVHKQSKQLMIMNEKVAMLTAKSMEKNITISGITEAKKENCKQLAIDFLKQKVEIDVADEEILVAHRIGKQAKINAA